MAPGTKVKLTVGFPSVAVPLVPFPIRFPAFGELVQYVVRIDPTVPGLFVLKIAPIFVPIICVFVSHPRMPKVTFGSPDAPPVVLGSGGDVNSKVIVSPAWMPSRFSGNASNVFNIAPVAGGEYVSTSYARVSVVVFPMTSVIGMGTSVTVKFSSTQLKPGFDGSQSPPSPDGCK